MLSAFTDLPIPRHVLQDDDNDGTDFLNVEEPIVPTVSTTIQSTKNNKFDYLLIVPSNLKVISEAINHTLSDNIEKIGIINIDYEDTTQEIDTESKEDEYDEQEQLYPAQIKASDLLYRYDNDKIDIFGALITKTNKKIAIVTIPLFNNKIVYNLVSRSLIESLITDELIVLGTSELNNGDSINKLLSANNTKDQKKDSLLSQVPLLRPPHFITGPSGAIISQFNSVTSTKTTALVLDAEGSFTLNREYPVDASIADAGYVIAEILDLESFSRALATRLRIQYSLSGASNLYL